MTDGHQMLSLLSKRQSERKYLEQPVEKEKTERILEAGRISPSACNGQPWKFIAIDDPDILAEISVAASAKFLNMNTFVSQAPLIIVVVREKSNLTSRAGDLIKSKDYSLIDIGISVASMTYQATAEGLGSCIVGWFDESRIRKILKVPGKKRIEVILTIGYTDNNLRTKIRKPPEEVISFNSY